MAASSSGARDDALGFWPTVGSGALVALVVALLGLAVTFLVTTRLEHKREERDRAWQQAQARRDRDLAGAVDFYRAYAEFFAIWKVWNAYHRNRDPSLKDIDDGQRFELLEAASRAEAGIEFMLLRIATENLISDGQAAALWCLRTAVKQLRYAMRKNDALSWWRTMTAEHQEGYDAYRAFKGLSSFLARLLADSTGQQELPARQNALERHREITGNLNELSYTKLLERDDNQYYQQLTSAPKDIRWVLLYDYLEPRLLAPPAGRPEHREGDGDAASAGPVAPRDAVEQATNHRAFPPGLTK